VGALQGRYRDGNERNGELVTSVGQAHDAINGFDCSMKSEGLDID